ncbi:MAG: S-methyl-5'-thioadenosine phosphorylase, partial [Pseudomonadota bacterium]
MLGVIGGTGAVSLLESDEQRTIETPWGQPSAELTRVDLGGTPAWFLPRHGNPHRFAPHRVNYQANIDAFRQLGVDQIIAINAVGGVDPDLLPGALVVPDQLIDYTWGR